LVDMMKSFAVGIIASLCLLASARAQGASTTYNITLTGELVKYCCFTRTGVCCTYRLE